MSTAIRRNGFLLKVAYGCPFPDGRNEPARRDKQLSLCRLGWDLFSGACMWLVFWVVLLTCIAAIIALVSCAGYALYAIYTNKFANFSQNSASFQFKSGVGLVFIGFFVLVFGLTFVYVILKHVVIAGIAKTKLGRGIALAWAAMKQKTCPTFQIVD